MGDESVGTSQLLPLRQADVFRRSAPFVASAVLAVVVSSGPDLRGASTPRLAALAVALTLVATFPFAPWERLPHWVPALPVAAGFSLVLWPGQAPPATRAIEIGGLLGMDTIAVTLYCLPWDRLPRWLHALPPLGAMVAVFLLRHGTGAEPALLFPIAVLAVLWMALHHTRGELLAGVVAAGAIFLVPDRLGAGYDIAPQLLYTAIVAVVAVSVQSLVAHARAQAAEIAEVARDLSAMQEVAATMVAALDVDAILAEGVRVAAEIVPSRDALRRGAAVVRRESERFVVAAAHARGGGEHVLDSVIAPENAAGLAAAIADREVRGGTLARPGPTGAGGALAPAYLAAPLVVEGAVFGLLVVVMEQAGEPTPRQHERLRGVVSVTELALATAVTLLHERSTAHRLSALVASNLSLARGTDAAALLVSLADRARDLGGAQYVAITVLTLDGRRVESVSESGMAPPGAGMAFEPLDVLGGVTGKVLRERRPVRTSPQLAAVVTGGRVEAALLCMPLMLGPQPLGVVSLVGKRGGPAFTAEDEVVVGGLAAQVAVAISNARLFERLAEHAASDALTGLCNRRQFERTLSAVPRQPFAILAIDIDNLKAVNDEFGHEAGDVLIQVSAATMKAVLRGGDILARVGGDEFAALLLDADAAAAVEVADRMRTALHGTALPHGRARISAGCVAAPRGADPHGVWRAADEALTRAKRTGKDRVVVRAHAGGSPAAGAQSRWAETLVDVLAEHAIEAVYQPVVSLDDRTTVAYEALARPAGLAPSASVDGLFHAAQRLGRMRDLDWLCRRAALQGLGRMGEHMSVFVNVSAGTLLDPIHDVDQMLLVCTFAGVSPDRLVLEITERETIRELGRLRLVTAAYREHGIRFALDDVGEGHSTLEAMAALSPEYLKVASSLAARMERSGSRAAVRAAVAFANSTGAAVIAEGVETEPIADAVRALGVRLGQGFWLGRPVRASALPLGADASLPRVESGGRG